MHPPESLPDGIALTDVALLMLGAPTSREVNAATCSADGIHQLDAASELAEMELLNYLNQRRLGWSLEGACAAVEAAAGRAYEQQRTVLALRAAEEVIGDHPESLELGRALERLILALELTSDHLYQIQEHRSRARRVMARMHLDASTALTAIDIEDAWGQAIVAGLRDSLAGPAAHRLLDLCCRAGTGARPGVRWRPEAADVMADRAVAALAASFLVTFTELAVPNRHNLPSATNADLLRSVAWALGVAPDPPAELLCRATLHAAVMPPQSTEPFCAKLVSAGVWALTEIGADTELGRLWAELTDVRRLRQVGEALALPEAEIEEHVAGVARAKQRAVRETMRKRHRAD